MHIMNARVFVTELETNPRYFLLGLTDFKRSEHY